MVFTNDPNSSLYKPTCTQVKLKKKKKKLRNAGLSQDARHISFFFYYFIHALVLIIFKLCIYAKSISLRHKNYNFSIVIGLKSLHFSINLFPKLLSDSLSWNSSINQSHPKLQFKSTDYNLGFNHHRNTNFFCQSFKADFLFLL